MSTPPLDPVDVVERGVRAREYLYSQAEQAAWKDGDLAPHYVAWDRAEDVDALLAEIRRLREENESNGAEIRRLYSEVQDRAQETLDAHQEVDRLRAALASQEPVAWRYRYVMDGKPTKWYLAHYQSVLATLEGEVEVQALVPASPVREEGE